MGRLFWKFLVLLMIAQVTMVVAVSIAISLRHRSHAALPEPGPPHSARRILDTAAATLERDGEPALRELLAGWSREPLPTLLAVDANGHEILGRPLPRELRGGGPAAGEPSEAPLSRRVALPDGRAYLLFIDEHDPGPPGGRRGADGPGRPGSLFVPLEPIFGGILASLAVAALLAWYVSKPIRNLRQAFDAAAQGNLDVHIGDSMGRRRDELADLGRDFDRMAAHLKRLMDGQRRLLHDVSHELRSPLARLQAAVGLARQQPGNFDVSMDRIERESVRMDKLVDELLALSRVEAGIGSEHEESVDLVELVDEVVRDVTFEVGPGRAPVSIDTDVAALAEATVKGNPEALHRALENVVRNAARYTPTGGRIRIVGECDGAHRDIRIAIRDDGPGVAAGELEAIFEPFYRGVQAKGTTGHGLGLAIARRVVEAHGGSIRASNRASGGLEIEIRLPT